jgi:hypothetical protein
MLRGADAIRSNSVRLNISGTPHSHGVQSVGATSMHLEIRKDDIVKRSFACLCVLLAGLVSANAETTKQKLQYIKAITGVSCSADRLTVYADANGAVAATLPAASVTIIKGKLDSKGESWVYVSNDKTRQLAGWVRLLDLSCI